MSARSSTRRSVRRDFSHLAGAVFTEQQVAARQAESEVVWGKVIAARRARGPLPDPRTNHAAMRFWD
jgi:hypothetical protein